MRVGPARRQKEKVFASFARDEVAQARQQEMLWRFETQETILQVQQILNMAPDENETLTPKKQKLLLLVVSSLRSLIEELQKAYAELEAEHSTIWEQMELKLARANELSELRAQLIEAMKLQANAREEEVRNLQGTVIEELTSRIEELSKSNKSSSNEPKAEKTLEERKKELEARLRRSKARQEKLQQKLEELRAIKEESENPEEVSDAGCQTVVQQHQDADAGSFQNGCMVEKVEPGPSQEVGIDIANHLCRDSQGLPNLPAQEEPVASKENLQHEDVSVGHMTTTPEEEESRENKQTKETGTRETDSANSQSQSTDPRELNERIKELQERIRELEEQQEESRYQAKKGCDTSNKPSGKRSYQDPKTNTKSASFSGGKDENASSEEAFAEKDVFEEEKEAEEAARRDPNKSPSGKPASGQRGKKLGSPGGGRTMPEFDVEREVRCNPAQCEQCPHCKDCEALKNAQKTDQPRFVFDIEMARVLTRYQLVSCKCPLQGGQTLKGSFPEGVNNWFRYGSGLRALAVTLNTVGMVSYERISDILQGLIGDEKLSGKTINNWVAEMADQAQAVARLIKAGAFSSPFLHSDETGVRVKGDLHWVHTACNDLFTYMRVDKKRGNDAMSRIGILPAYMGTVITDCLASYWDKGSRHGLCNAHLLRELFALVKFFERDKGWAQKMLDLFRKMNRERNELIEQGVTQFTEEQLEEYKKQYHEIIEEGMIVHPDSEAKKGSRGRAKKCRGRNLLDRLTERETNYLLFLTDFDVPFTNNMAERSLRMVSVKRSVVGSFDTYEGADDFALIWSYISTARKRGLNSYKAIQAAMSGEAVSYLFDEEEIRFLEEEAVKLGKLNVETFEEVCEQDKQEIDVARREVDAKIEQANAATQNLEKATEKLEKALNEEATARSRKPGRSGDRIAKASKRVAKANAAVDKAREVMAKKVQAAKDAMEDMKKQTEDFIWKYKAAIYFLDLPEEALDDLADLVA